MNEEDIQLVRDITRDLIYEILDAEVWDVILELVNGQEAGITAFKQRLKRTKVGWDASKIKWEQAQGTSGPYERSEDVNNPEFKAMLKDLASHGGKMTRDGYFMWVFKNGTTIGRKRRCKQKSKASETKPEKLFPEDLRVLLSFEETEDSTIIRPRQFLGSENFAKIADIVKQRNGEWVSAGKQSHFKIPIKS